VCPHDNHYDSCLVTKHLEMDISERQGGDWLKLKLNEIKELI